MPKNSLFALLLFVGVMTFSVVSVADVCSDCIGTGGYTTTCRSSDGCDHTLFITYCIRGGGCDGNFCSDSYGLCCGLEITEETPSGQCDIGDRRASAHGSHRWLAVPEDAPEDSSDKSLRVIYVPYRCAHSYGVIDLGAL
jgi:hypothetical protein